MFKKILCLFFHTYEKTGIVPQYYLESNLIVHAYKCKRCGHLKFTVEPKE